MKRLVTILAVSTLMLGFGCEQRKLETGKTTAATQTTESSTSAAETTVDDHAGHDHAGHDHAGHDHAAVDHFAACKGAIRNAGSKPDPVSRGEMIMSSCRPLLGEKSCNEALDGDHSKFWSACIDAYCPKLQAAGYSSVVCTATGTPEERAFMYPARASFIADLVSMDRSLGPIDESLQKELADMVETPAESRQEAAKAMVAKILTSSTLSSQQKEVWSISLVLATIEPISPPPPTK